MALRNVEALSNNEYGICAEWIIKNCYEEFTEMHGADYYATCSETTMGGMGECAAVESKIPKSDASQCLHCIRYYWFKFHKGEEDRLWLQNLSYWLVHLMIIVNSMNSLYYLSFFLMLLFPSCSKSEGQIEKIVNSMPKNIQKLELKGESLASVFQLANTKCINRIQV